MTTAGGSSTESAAVRLSRWIFAGAGIYGLLALSPQFAAEGALGRDWPPPITHPEYFYGFLALGMAWQVAFLIIARDPIRFRPLMPAAMAEKFGFLLVALALFVLGRLTWVVLAFAILDGILGLLFLTCWLRLRPLELARRDGPSSTGDQPQDGTRQPGGETGPPRGWG
jgi:hypothetical protein